MGTSDRLPVVVSLILAAAIAGVLLTRGRGADPARAGEPDHVSGAAALAHRAAGVEGGVVGPVAPGFRTRVDAARADLDAAPDDTGRILTLARILHDGHRPDEAVALYRRALELDPSLAEATYDLAAALAATGEWAAATRVLEDRVREVPLDAVALYDLGAVRANAGDVEGARRWFTRAAEAATDDALRERTREALERLAGGTP